MKQIVRFDKSFLLVIGVFMLLSLTATSVFSQSMDDLQHLKGHKTDTYYSADAKEQAENMAKLLDNVMIYYKSLIDFEPSVTLLVLSQKDWNKYTTFPVFGMPHYTSDQKLIVASEDNDFWKSFIPPLEQLPSETAQLVLKTYSEESGRLSMRGFFDLLAVHELGHAYHIQGGLKMQRMWMGELFSNIFLHTYVAEKEPELLNALTVFPRMVVSTTIKDDLRYTSLQELETNYDLIGQQYPNNYGWYQCRWHNAAGEIYDAGGIKVMNRLWQALREEQESIDDSSFVKMLSDKVHQSVADVHIKWDE